MPTDALPTVTLGGATVQLVSPSPMMALCLLLSEEDVRAGLGAIVPKSAGALRACWPTGTREAVGVSWPGGPLPRLLAVGREDVYEWGAAIFDGLVRGGVDYAEVLLAGRTARELCGAALPSAAEVKAAEDFSEAPAG